MQANDYLKVKLYFQRNSEVVFQSCIWASYDSLYFSYNGVAQTLVLGRCLESGPPFENHQKRIVMVSAP